MILKCVVCGKEMTAQRQNKLYCSIECQRAARKERIKNKNSSLKKNLRYLWKRIYCSR